MTTIRVLTRIATAMTSAAATCGVRCGPTTAMAVTRLSDPATALDVAVQVLDYDEPINSSGVINRSDDG
ncbi:hypothetical protein HanHA300_Chr02g0044981 [Helianthus annuus]|nr:hypothetical protein HanHA300_Chr02g0044981 [Helianthus annuus]KAJ0618031.1 hypothetical protein HanHA89_Chr02g0048571 [Helianthus annuus]